MTSPDRGWMRAAKLAASAALTLAMSLPALSPAHAQSDPVPGEPDDRRDLPFSELLGPWIRNDSLSEHPVRKAESLELESRNDSSRMREITQEMADRSGTIMIRVLQESLVLLDNRGGTRIVPVDGEQHPLGRGVKGRVLEAEERLAVEIVGSDGRQVDTFHLEHDWLVRWTDLEPHELPPLEIQTVYGRPVTAPDWDSPTAGPSAAIRIVPPERRYGELLSGRVEIQTMIINPRIVEVEFFLDDRQIRRIRRPPFGTRIRLAAPPRQQTLEVLAYDEDDEVLGRDEFVLNQMDKPFAVRIAEMSSQQTNDDAAVRVTASVSLPRTATLERVEFYRSELLVAAIHTFGEEATPGAARTIPVETLIEGDRPDDFIRVVAKLADGREREDAQLLQGADYQSEIDVQLVQFQVLVTDPDGNPVSGLSPEDFEIRENGRKRPAVTLHTGYDVPLVLGLAIDSSDSMLPTWSRLKYVARSFLQAAVTPGDRAFLVDFDATVRLIQPLTGDQSLLSDRLDYLIPMGGTALNDGLLFSLLEYRGEPGRRALIVITDGADQHSRSRPEQSSEFAGRLGLPIYFIELDASVPGIGRSVIVEDKARKRARKRLSAISEQTGGRLFHLKLYDTTRWWTDGIEQVFDQIEEDLRHQHVLTWYSSQPPGTAIEPEIRVIRRGLKLRSAVPLVGIE